MQLSSWPHTPSSITRLKFGNSSRHCSKTSSGGAQSSPITRTFFRRFIHNSYLVFISDSQSFRRSGGEDMWGHPTPRLGASAPKNPIFLPNLVYRHRLSTWESL